MSAIRTYLNPHQRAMVIARIAVMLIALLAGTVLCIRLYRGLSLAQARLGADIILVPEETTADFRGIALSGHPSPHTLPAAALERAGNVEGVAKASPQLFLRPAPFTCCGRDDVLLVVIDPDSDFTISPWMDKGRLPDLAADQIIVGGDIPVLAGDTILFFGTAFRVAALLERSGDGMVDRSVFMTAASAQAMAEASKVRSPQPVMISGPAFSAVLVEVKRGERPERVALRLEHAVPGARAEVASGPARSVRERLQFLKRGVVMLVVVLWLSGVILIAWVLSLAASRSRPETPVPL